MTLPQDRKTPEREIYQEVNCNGKEMNKKEVNYGNVVCGQGTTGSKEMNKNKVNDGNVVCGKGTTFSKGSNYGYSLKIKREIKTEEQWNENSPEEAQEDSHSSIFYCCHSFLNILLFLGILCRLCFLAS